MRTNVTRQFRSRERKCMGTKRALSVKHSTLVYVWFSVKGKMGQSLTTMYRTYYSSPDTSPDGFGDPIHRPNYGFPAERKKRSTYLRRSLPAYADRLRYDTIRDAILTCARKPT